MAKGQTVDQLFLSLGLDMTQLDADFVTADRTVSQAMQELSRKKTQAKVRMEIDMTAYQGAENTVQALALKEQHLTEQLKLQKNAVAIVNATYQESVRAKGADDAASQRILTRLLREQKSEADLAAQIRNVNKVRLEGATVSETANVAGTIAAATSASMAKVGQATTAARSGILALNASMASMMAMALTGAGLFNLVKGAVDAGEAVYQMSGKLHIGTDEAGNLSRMLKLTDVDSQSFISTMIRLDRGVETAGKNGNSTTNALKEFNVSITDSNGKLLPMNQQLAALAKGYQEAAKAGNEEAYVSQVLGARGAALVPILRDYAEAAEAASRVKTIGIDPDQAHELSIELKVLQMESSQLGNAMGAALMPVAKEVAPMVIEGMQEIIQSIKDNKDEIADITKMIIEFGKATSEVLETAVKPLFSFILDNKATIVNALKEVQTEMRMIQNHPALATFGFAAKLDNSERMQGYREEAQAQIEAENEVAAAKRQAEKDDARRAKNAQVLADAQARSEAQASQQTIQTSKENLKAQEEVEAAIYHASHSRIENQLYDIDRKAQQSISAGIDEATAWEIAELQKAEATKKYDKEIEDSREQLSTAILKIEGRELEARLSEIEKERKAWIEKTEDEVAATEYAEQQKIKAVKDAVNAQYGAEIRAVQDAIKQGKDMTVAYEQAHQAAMKNKQTEQQSYDFVRKQIGVQIPGDVNTRIAVDTDKNIAYQLQEVVQSLKFDVQKLQPQQKTANVTNNIEITIPANNDGSVDYVSLADKVANEITQRLEPVLGGDDNSY